MGWMDSIKHKKLHQPFHVCLTCYLTPDWGLVFMSVPADWAILPWDRVVCKPQRSLCSGWDSHSSRGISYKYPQRLHNISQLYNLVNIYSQKWRLVGCWSPLGRICFFCFCSKLQKREKSLQTPKSYVSWWLVGFIKEACTPHFTILKLMTCFGLGLWKVWAEHCACVQSSSHPVKTKR